VIDVPEEGERARVLIVRTASYWELIHVKGVVHECLELVDRCYGEGEPPIDNLHDLERLLRQLAADATCARVLRIEAFR
jgi:hypothetical protein